MVHLPAAQTPPPPPPPQPHAPSPTHPFVRTGSSRAADIWVAALCVCVLEEAQGRLQAWLTEKCNVHVCCVPGIASDRHTDRLEVARQPAGWLVKKRKVWTEYATQAHLIAKVSSVCR